MRRRSEQRHSLGTVGEARDEKVNCLLVLVNTKKKQVQM